MNQDSGPLQPARIRLPGPVRRQLPVPAALSGRERLCRRFRLRTRESGDSILLFDREGNPVDPWLTAIPIPGLRMRTEPDLPCPDGSRTGQCGSTVLGCKQQAGGTPGNANDYSTGIESAKRKQSPAGLSSVFEPSQSVQCGNPDLLRPEFQMPRQDRGVRRAGTQDRLAAERGTGRRQA